ncbi:ATP-dependent RNA helicase, partial [Staphylococcus aureus]|nr:ATP-dependent RNA helicase [Staphylococcus aureus]
IAESLIKEYGDQKLVAALLQELITSNNDAEVQLTFEKPLSKKSNHRGKQGNRGGNSRGKSRTRFDGKNNKRRGNDKNNQFDRNKGKNN